MTRPIACSWYSKMIQDKLLKFHKKSTAGYTMHSFILHFALASLLILVASCTKEEPVQPPPPPPPPPPPTESDTTSHDYTWETYTIGDASTLLFDVFAVNDSDVYVVGEIYIVDSTGRLENNLRNAAHWDGKSWNIMRIKYGWQGDSGQASMRSTFAYGSKDVWVGSSLPQRWNGSKWIGYEMPGVQPGWVNGLFGLRTNELFAVNSTGFSSFFNGTGFQKLETGTTLELTDIYGNETEIWAVGGKPHIDRGVVLLKREASWEKIDSLSDNEKKSVSTVWCDEKGMLDSGFIAFGGWGIWYRDTTWKKPPLSVLNGGQPFGELFINSIRGTNRNNVFAVGDYGIVVHYNGKSWHFYKELFKFWGTRIYSSVSLTKNKVYIVGQEDGRGIIVIGTRR